MHQAIRQFADSDPEHVTLTEDKGNSIKVAISYDVCDFSFLITLEGPHPTIGRFELDRIRPKKWDSTSTIFCNPYCRCDTKPEHQDLFLSISFPLTDLSSPNAELMVRGSGLAPGNSKSQIFPYFVSWVKEFRGEKRTGKDGIMWEMEGVFLALAMFVESDYPLGRCQFFGLPLYKRPIFFNMVSLPRDIWNWLDHCGKLLFVEKKKIEVSEAKDQRKSEEPESDKDDSWLVESDKSESSVEGSKIMLGGKSVFSWLKSLNDSMPLAAVIFRTLALIAHEKTTSPLEIPGGDIRGTFIRMATSSFIATSAVILERSNPLTISRQQRRENPTYGLLKNRHWQTKRQPFSTTFHGFPTRSTPRNHTNLHQISTHISFRPQTASNSIRMPTKLTARWQRQKFDTPILSYSDEGRSNGRYLSPSSPKERLGSRWIVTMQASTDNIKSGGGTTTDANRTGHPDSKDQDQAANISKLVNVDGYNVGGSLEPETPSPASSTSTLGPSNRTAVPGTRQSNIESSANWAQTDPLVSSSSSSEMFRVQLEAPSPASSTSTSEPCNGSAESRTRQSIIERFTQWAQKNPSVPPSSSSAPFGMLPSVPTNGSTRMNTGSDKQMQLLRPAATTPAFSGSLSSQFHVQEYHSLASLPAITTAQKRKQHPSPTADFVPPSEAKRKQKASTQRTAVPHQPPIAEDPRMPSVGTDQRGMYAKNGASRNSEQGYCIPERKPEGYKTFGPVLRHNYAAPEFEGPGYTGNGSQELPKHLPTDTEAYSTENRPDDKGFIIPLTADPRSLNYIIRQGDPELRLKDQITPMQAIREYADSSHTVYIPVITEDDQSTFNVSFFYEVGFFTLCFKGEVPPGLPTLKILSGIPPLNQPGTRQERPSSLEERLPGGTLRIEFFEDNLEAGVDLKGTQKHWRESKLYTTYQNWAVAFLGAESRTGSKGLMWEMEGVLIGLAMLLEINEPTVTFEFRGFPLHLEENIWFRLPTLQVDVWEWLKYCSYSLELMAAVDKKFCLS
ncbi:hypothetical protein BJ508DRAFT_312387 [Ascobolus immersus RN42]|uniref:Uncharacterized protein n=1 Tax=Ascobolus immersus RN42 TaxID=1160509 RepID=A0A3N4HMB6_ASCIM|nr:hypothetical protein BJ508DRAFT_312387 [Ascobolus immersus RN42]